MTDEMEETMNGNAESSSADKIREALDLLNQAASESKAELKEILASKHTDLESLLKLIGAEVRGAAHLGAERLDEMREAGEAKLRDAADLLDRKVHDEPWRMLGWATVGALVFGYILGSRD
jgi:ElaB/YqjD/DUF883 family membrane-anchored ribosome-binding protein